MQVRIKEVANTNTETQLASHTSQCGVLKKTQQCLSSILARTHCLSLVTRGHQTNPKWGTVKTRRRGAVFVKNVSIIQDKDRGNIPNSRNLKWPGRWRHYLPDPRLGGRGAPKIIIGPLDKTGMCVVHRGSRPEARAAQQPCESTLPFLGNALQGCASENHLMCMCIENARHKADEENAVSWWACVKDAWMFSTCNCSVSSKLFPNKFNIFKY